MKIAFKGNQKPWQSSEAGAEFDYAFVSINLEAVLSTIHETKNIVQVKDCILKFLSEIEKIYLFSQLN